MDLPNPRKDYLGALEWLIEQTARNADDLKLLKSAIGVRNVLFISDLAKRWGVSVSVLYSNFVKLPNFGRPDIGKGKKGWFLETVEKWEEKDEEEHRKDWELMSYSEKQKYLGPVEEAAS